MYISFETFSLLDLIPFLPFVFGFGKDDEPEPTPPVQPAQIQPTQIQPQVMFIPPPVTPPPSPTATSPAALSPLERKMNELAIRESELAIARLEAQATASQQPPIMARINPEIQADIFGNIQSQINQETEDARRLIISDIAGRGLTGSGIEQSALENLQKRRERQLTEANRFAATESAKFGLSTADLALRQQQAQQSARQFNVGIASNLENIAQQRALNRFGTLSGVRESALDRSLLAAQTRGSQALQQRGQDVSIFETLSQRAAENRKKKESLLGTLAGGIGSAVGTATGLGGGLAIGKRLGG